MLRRSTTIREIVPDEAGDGALTVVLSEPTTGCADMSLNAVIRPLLDADLPLLACELERGRLSDAFLTTTERAGE